ncbi:hypothetical protein AOQ84DRAFT_416228 [Glonium stellatum]|uniref:Uncharacterized protein n=1 Tax=Glonium stellatum TaxID=574774 RepID=A0A8E2ETA6_9PEZI|nr:hypothetical protein AOQ84DRAFT_416228 [Glonium stellatum]
MGQYWLIAAPSRGQRLSDDGKLPELFWNGAGSGLQRQLMVPQNTQDTQLLSKLQSYLDALYTPREEANTATTAQEERDDFARLMAQLGRIPLRGKARVCVGDFLNFDDMLPLMRLYFATSFGAWAGEQIVCVGDYAETSPQELYVQGEKRSLYNRTANNDTGNAILSHICWTNNPSTSMDYDFDHLLHGPWAGHRFKILPISALEKLITEDEDWQDVTKELYDVVDKIFDAIG